PLQKYWPHGSSGWQAVGSCPCGSVVEHSLGKGEVARSIRAMGTTDPHGDRNPVVVRRQARPCDLVERLGRWGGRQSGSTKRVDEAGRMVRGSNDKPNRHPASRSLR